MSYQTPCLENSEDWFIGKDGKQYSDDEFVTEDDLTDRLNELYPHGLDLQSKDGWAEMLRVRNRMESDAKRDALARRRHAKEACYGCYFRSTCLDLALSNPTPATHGTWGGYFEEELRETRTLRDRRKRVFNN